MLLQTVLRGKAQKTYASLLIKDCANYEAVKLAILKCYELVPEAYRQRFRGHRKAEDQTNQKERYFERWSSSKGVREDYDKLNNTYRVQNCMSD